MTFKTRVWLCVPVGIASLLMLFYMIQPKNAGNRDIAMIISNTNNPFFQRVIDGADDTAQASDYNLKVVESENDPANELELMEMLVNEKYQVVLINPIDETLTQKAIAYAQAHNVKVITMDSNVSDLKVYAHIASNNLSGGEKAADYMIKSLHDQGNIAVVRGVTTTSSSQERYKGFVDRIKQSNLKIITIDNGNFTKLGGYHATKKIIKEHPSINGIFYENDTMAIGGVMAINDQKNIVIVGFDGINEVLSLINHNKIDATVEQNPYAIGEFATKYAINYLSSHKIPKDNSVLIPITLITKKEIERASYKSCYSPISFRLSAHN